jgi:hypothetical protein
MLNEAAGCESCPMTKGHQTNPDSTHTLKLRCYGDEAVISKMQHFQNNASAKSRQSAIRNKNSKEVLARAGWEPNTDTTDSQYEFNKHRMRYGRGFARKQKSSIH